MELAVKELGERLKLLLISGMKLNTAIVNDAIGCLSLSVKLGMSK
jgi:hypothetical protein